MTLLQKIDGAFRPHGPLPEQSAREMHRPIVSSRKRRQQIRHDRIVISGIERDISSSAPRQRRDDVERAVSIEWSDLDRDHTLDVEQAAPEVLIEDAAAHGWLQVEADERDHGGDTAAVLQHDVIVDVAERGKTEERRVVAER